LDQQVDAISIYADLGSQVPIPPWAGTTRFGEELKQPPDELDSSGTAISYANTGYQISYSYVAPVAQSHIGDEVLLVSSRYQKLPAR